MDRRPTNKGRPLSADDIRREAQAYRDRRARLERARGKAGQKVSRPYRKPEVESEDIRRPQGRSARRRRRRWTIAPRGWVFLGILGLLILFGISSLIRACSGPDPVPPRQEEGQDQGTKEGAGTPDILSSSAILMDMGNGNILFESAPNEPCYPASLTKMMTVYVALVSGESLDGAVTLDQEAFTDLYEQGASIAGFQVGEVVTLRDLLYAAILPSGGDASQAIGLAVSGDMDRFVDRMNEEAKKMGMDSTHFVNPTGLHDPNHVTTARDLARFLKHALGNANFRQVFTTPSYTTSPTAIHGQGLTFQATYLKHMEEFNLHPPKDRYDILGAKTGYTPEAGVCLASLAGKDHKEYVAITLNAQGDGENYYPAFKDTLNLYDKAFKA